MKNPLLKLTGIWKGNQGIDLAPKPDEDENNPYYETLIIEPLDAEIDNAEEQELLAVIYKQEVREKANDKISHSETGYWLWDKNSNRIMNSFTIPRGVCVLASGKVKEENGELIFSVEANINDDNCTLAQSQFMMSKAKTLSFKREFRVSENSLSYSQETLIDIYGKKFNHIDKNTLNKNE
jgi:hypothetical protein